MVCVVLRGFLGIKNRKDGLREKTDTQTMAGVTAQHRNAVQYGDHFGNVPQAAAASTYNGQQAATWGWNNYKNNYGLCAEFVSNCLKQGGFTDAFSNSCGTLRRQLLNSGAFQENVVYLNSNKRLYTSGSNSGKIAVGDVIMWHKSGTSTYPHTALVYSISKGYVQTVQRNPAGSYSYLNYTPYDNNGTKYEVICYHYVGKQRNDPIGAMTVLVQTRVRFGSMDGLLTGMIQV